MASDLNIIIQQANSAILARDYSFAEKLLKKQLEKISDKSSEDAIKIKGFLGKLYLRSGSMDKGLNIYKDLNQIKPDNVEIINNIGIIYRRLNQFEDSVASLEKAKNLDETNVTTLYNLGNTYKQKEDYEKAINCFLKVLDAKSDDVLAYNHLGSVYLLCGKVNEAINSYKAGLRIDPNHPFLNFNLANIYKDQKKYNEAIIRYKGALKTSPKWKDALTGMADAYIKNNELPKAINMYKEIIEKNDENEYSLTKLAELYEINNDDKEAEKYYKKALDFKSTFIPAILSYAKMLKKQNRYFDAYNLLAEAKDVKNKELLLQLADISLLLEDYSMTKECLKNLIENWDEDFETLKMKGKLYSMLGEKEKAETIFRTILNKAPREIKLRLELADLYAHNDKHMFAIQELLKYLNEKPQDISARLKLGKSYEACDDYKNARKEYNKIIKNDKKNTEALKAIMELNRKEGNDAEAIKLANEIVDINVADESSQNLDELSDSLELYEEAVSVYGDDELLNKNLEQFKDSDEGVDITPEGFEEDLNLEIEQEDEVTLSNDFENISDSEMPFDDLMSLADDDYFEERDEENIEDLVSFDEPIDDAPNFDNDAELNMPSAGINPKKQNDYIPEEEITLENPAPVQRAMPQTPSSPMQFESGEEEFLNRKEPEPSKSPKADTLDNYDNGYDDSSELDLALPEEDKDLKEDDFIVEDTPLSENKAPAESSPLSNNKPLSDDAFAPDEMLSSLNKTAETMGDVANQLSEKLDELKDLAQSKATSSIPETSKPELSVPDMSDTIMPEADAVEFDTVEPDIPEAIMPEADDIEFDTVEPDIPETIMPETSTDEVIPEVGISEDSISDTGISDTGVLDALPSESSNISDSKATLLNSIPRKLKSQTEFERELELIRTDEILNLFSYLRDLMVSLPEEELKDFLISNERIQMEYIITKLRGELGLKDKVALMQIKNTLEKTQTPKDQTEKTLKDTLGYLRIVASQLPDKGFAASCSKKINKLMQSLNS